VRPFRFAVHGAQVVSGEQWKAIAQRAEALGYEALLMPDHLGDQLSPISGLSAAAAVTSRLRVGAYVFANDYRHPLILAREAATLDALSDGRFELGLGAGWRTNDYRQLGYAYDRPGRRIDRLEEAVGLVKRLLRGERVTHEGRFYSLKGARIAPRPMQRPHPPIIMGGGGPRMLRLAAREADIVGLIPQFSSRGRTILTDITEAAAERKAAIVREAAGARFDRITIDLFIHDAGLIGSGRPLPESLLSAGMAAGAALIRSPYALFGTLGQLRERLERRRDRTGISAYSVPIGAMESMAPLVEALAGT
jgi:probable F420-dependent oxidoreductase